MRIRTGMAVVFLACSCVFGADTLEDEFRSPPPWTRPWCYWFWINGDVTEEGITRDLELMADSAIQYALVTNFHHDELKTTGPATDLLGIDPLDQKARKDRDTVFGVCHSVYNMTPDDPDDTLQYLWCVSGDWKLLLRHDGSDTTQYKNIHIWDKRPVRLYNLKDDPHERNELSSAHPEIVEALRKKIEAWHPVGKD